MSRSTRIFVIALVVIGLAFAAGRYGYKYSENAHKSFHGHWSQPYQMTVLEVGSPITSIATINGEQTASLQRLDVVKLVSATGKGSQILRVALSSDMEVRDHQAVKIDKQGAIVPEGLADEQPGPGPGPWVDAYIFGLVAAFIGGMIAGLILFPPKRKVSRDAGWLGWEQ